MLGVVDRELGVNVVDLGLMPAVGVQDANVTIDLVLTIPGCPLSGRIADQVRCPWGALP